MLGFGLVVIPATFWIVLEPPQRLPCPPYVPLYRVVVLDGLLSEQGTFEKVLNLRFDYVSNTVYLTPVSDEVVFCDGMED